MKTHEIIDSYHNLLKNSELLFYVWFASKYPFGALLSEIRIKSHVESRHQLKIFGTLIEAGLVTVRQPGTEYAYYTPTTTRLPRRAKHHFRTKSSYSSHDSRLMTHD